MNSDQKLLLIGGTVVAVISAFYIASSTVPATPKAAVLFPLSILGILFGVGFVIWGLSWILLEKFKVLK